MVKDGVIYGAILIPFAIIALFWFLGVAFASPAQVKLNLIQQIISLLVLPLAITQSSGFFVIEILWLFILGVVIGWLIEKFNK